MQISRKTTAKSVTITNMNMTRTATVTSSTRSRASVVVSRELCFMWDERSQSRHVLAEGQGKGGKGDTEGGKVGFERKGEGKSG